MNLIFLWRLRERIAFTPGSSSLLSEPPHPNAIRASLTLLGGLVTSCSRRATTGGMLGHAFYLVAHFTSGVGSRSATPSECNDVHSAARLAKWRLWEIFRRRPQISVSMAATSLGASYWAS